MGNCCQAPIVIVEINDGLYRGSVTKDGMPEGQGTWVSHNQLVSYEGNWVAGKKHGYGVQINADGTKYDGIWVVDVFVKGRHINNDGTYMLKNDDANQVISGIIIKKT